MISQKGITSGFLIGTVLCAVAFFCTLFMALQQNAKMDNGVLTEAGIIQKTKTEYNRGHSRVYGIAVYTDENGEQHTYEGYLGSSVDTGDRITLIYDRDDPDSVLIKDESLSWKPWVYGAVMLYFSLCLVLYLRHVRKKQI